MDEKQKKHPLRRRYMKDYELQTELNDDGREVKVTRYKGNLFDTGLDTGALLSLRRRCLALSLGAAAAAIVALLLRHGAMTSFLAILPLAFAMFPLFYGALGCSRLPRAAKDLRSDEVEYSFERVRHSAPGIAILGALAVIGTFLHHLFFKDADASAFSWGDGAFLLCCLAVTVCGALLWRCIRRIRLTERPQKAKWAEAEENHSQDLVKQDDA